ncbi:MAG TPA: GWxTD domain-containing protein [Saprospiraceae bacterium]|nr:GWxTD domain-containing protein [Saprospiraceae bacterium]HMP25418.1 GWxTD domain-containing protein [Saprospiraceae bacterium]
MKTVWLLFIGLLIGHSTCALDAAVSCATFKSGDQPYVEVYFYFAGPTLTFAPVQDSLQQAQVEVVLFFQQQEQIVQFDKYTLHSPVAAQPLDFLDLKRYALPNGTYQLTVELRDAHRPDQVREYRMPLRVDYTPSGIQQSDIQLLASYQRTEIAEHPFVKNGILMEPLPLHFYSKNMATLSFYHEIYHTDEVLTEDFMVSYAIEKVENNSRQTLAIGHKRLTPQPRAPVLLQMDISQLPSGNYHLSVEVRDRHKELLSRRTAFFQRSNPYLQAQELAKLEISDEFVAHLDAPALEFSLRALAPKIPPGDVELVNIYLRDKNLQGQRLYLFNYWTRQHPNYPETAYAKYMEVARAVHEQFKSGFRYGFESDRGYIFLKYGAPSDIETREDEPSAPPYEIWTYNAFPATRQNNVKFVFYNPTLAPGDFQLLHTNAIGELNNPQWELQLYRNAPNEINGSFFDGTQMQDNFHRNARRIFRDN